MVEFAILVPLLITIVLGIVGFGYAYNQQISLQSAVREGARELALGNPGKVDNAVRQAAPSVDIGSITPEGNCDDAGVEKVSVTATVLLDLPMPFPFLKDKELTATGVMRCGL